jgi:hypothetical protein
MIGTLEALLVALIAVLPGALYTIARENHGASWAWRGTDGATLIFRLLTFSAVFHALFAWVTYRAYQQLDVTDELYDGKPISWWWYLTLLAYIAIPYLWGVLVEKQRRKKFIQKAVRVCWVFSPSQASAERGSPISLVSSRLRSSYSAFALPADSLRRGRLREEIL